MSNQITLRNLAWYALGVRLKQAQIVFSYEADETTANDEFFPTALNRLLDSVLRLLEMEGDHNLREEVNDLRSTYRQWREVKTEEDAFRAMRQVRAYLNSVIARSDSWTMQIERPQLFWFQLGREIADGEIEVVTNEADEESDTRDIDDSVSNTPRSLEAYTLPQPEIPDSCTSRWIWKREARVYELLSLVDHNLREVFTDSSDLVDGSATTSVKYPLELLGWERIEIGLQIMESSVRLSASLLPRWDAQHRTLYVGNRSAKVYTRRAPNQFSVLDIFERTGWPREIESPFSNSQHDDTINGINERINPLLIQFSGYGSSAIRYELGSEAFTETQ